MPSDRVMDVVDLVPHLTGTKLTPPHEILFWRDFEMYKSWGKGFSVRKGKWKLLREPRDYDWRRGTPEIRQKYADVYEKPYNSIAGLYAGNVKRDDDADRSLIQLYDLSTDLGENRDLAAQRTEVVDELLKEYKRWESQLMHPLWERPYWERWPITRLAAFEKKRTEDFQKKQAKKS